MTKRIFGYTSDEQRIEIYLLVDRLKYDKSSLAYERNKNDPRPLIC